jgi:hypothetical protein
MREKGGKGSYYVHNADVHVFIGASLQEDLLAGATFLGCRGDTGTPHVVRIKARVDEDESVSSQPKQ